MDPTLNNALTVGEQKNAILAKLLGRFVPPPEKRQHIHRRIINFVRRWTSERIAQKLDAGIEANTINVPNLFSVIRIPLALAFAVFYQLMPYDFALAAASCLTVIFLILASDYLDGTLADLMEQVTELGRKLDPICDKVAAIIIALVLVHKFWLWVLISFFTLELLLVLGAVKAQQFRSFFPKLVVSANDYGKWKYNFQGVAAICFILDVSEAGNYAMIVANLLALGSLIRHLYPSQKQIAKLAREATKTST